MTSPVDLATLADCKAWLGVTSTADDGLIAGLITAVSQAIMADLGRTLGPAFVSETFDGGGESSLTLRQWPVTGVVSCALDGLPLRPSGSPGQAGYILDTPSPAPPGGPQRLSYVAGSFTRGIGNIALTYRAGYEVLGEAATVPVTAPYTVSALAPFGAWSLDSGVTGAAGTYTAAGGVYTFGPAAAGAQIVLNYGYVPADLARAAIEWVADRYAGRTRIGQTTRTLGGQETAAFLVKAMPDIVSRLLQPYRRVA